MRLYQKDTYTILDNLEGFLNEIKTIHDNDLKSFIYRLKSCISETPILSEKFKKKTEEFAKYIKTKNYNETCHYIAEIIKDASFKIYQDDLYCKWYPAPMYNTRLNKLEFLNINFCCNRDDAIIFQGLYDFYNLLLINEPEKKNTLFIENGNAQFIDLTLSTMLNKANSMDDKSQLLIKQFIEIINPAIDFHNVDTAEILMLAGLHWEIFAFRVRLSLIKVLMELKEHVLIKAESESKSHKDIKEKKMLYLQYSPENDSFTLGGQPLKLKPYQIKTLKILINHALKVINRNVGLSGKYKVSISQINKIANNITGKDLIEKRTYKIMAKVRGFEGSIN